MSNNPSGVPFTVRVDEIDSNISYIGNALPGSDENKPVWQIKKVIVSGAITNILFANGNDFFLNKWSDRVTLSYS